MSRGGEGGWGGSPSEEGSEISAGVPPGVPAGVASLFSPELRRRLLTLRRDLHRRPELSRKEHETGRRLAEALAEAGAVDISEVAGTGRLARIPGRAANASRGGPAVAIRGDIDALPIQEATGLSYASETPGVMHACGHDVHASWAVGAAALLAESPAAGDVWIVLQPAEEVAWGAAEIMRSGVLDGVRAIFGGHVDRRFEVGSVVAQEGPLAASSDSFEIDLLGRGAHGARPHEAADPVVGAGALIGALQTVVSRRLEPGVPGVLSIGRLQAGSAPNVLPDRVHLAGTLRATRPETRAFLIAELRRITSGIAAAYGLRSEVRILEGTPPVVNAPRASAWAREAAVELLGAEGIRPLGGINMAGEDFAYYLEGVEGEGPARDGAGGDGPGTAGIEGCFLRIGAREPGGEVLPAHNPRFYAADGALFVGAAVLAAAARRASAALAGG